MSRSGESSRYDNSYAHGAVARVEIAPEELPRALDPAAARAIVAALKPLGFRYVALDLEGYRMGALNEVLPSAQREVPPSTQRS